MLILKNLLIIFIAGLFLAGNVKAFELDKKFIDEEYGYSLKYPSGWDARINRSGIVIADINSDDDLSGLQIRAEKLNIKINIFMDAYIEKFINSMQAVLISKKTAIFGAVSGFELCFKSNRSGREYFLKNYILPVAESTRIFIFQSGTPWQNRDAVEPVLDRIAESFRLNN